MGDLFQKIAAGSHEAYEELYWKYASDLLSFVDARLNNLDVAYDLVQDVFIRVWNRRELLAVVENEVGYLYSIARNEIAMYVRKEHTKRRYLNDSSTWGGTHENAEQGLLHRDLLEHVHAILNKLPKNTRKIFCYSRFEEKNTKEISELMGLSEQTIKNNISYALKELRNVLSKNAIQALILLSLLFNVI